MMTVALIRFTGLLVVTLKLCCAQDEHLVCSAHEYPGPDDVDIKLAVITGLREAKEGKCEASYLPDVLLQTIGMAWAADRLNGDNITDSFIPGVRIGIDVYDDCHTEYLSALHAGALASHIRGICQCPTCGTPATVGVPVAGIIGTSVSQTTTIVAKIIAPTKIPLVGISATLPELGDKSKYPGFMRTVPSDLEQAKVIIELAKRFLWSYIIGVQTSDNYGRRGMEEVKKLAEQERICICLVEEFEIAAEIPETQMEDFARTKLYDKIIKANGSIGVVYFGRNPALITLLQYITKQWFNWQAFNYLNRVYWVASDAVSAVEQLAELTNGFSTKIIVVGPSEVRFASFEKDFFGSFLENPPSWVTGQWQVAIKDLVHNFYGCSSYNFTKESLEGCSIEQQSTFNSYMTASLDAVYLMANTIKSIHQTACGGKPGMCQTFTSILEGGFLETYKMQDLNYSSIGSAYVPAEFLQSKRFLKNISGDFEAINQILFSLQANVGTGFVQVGDFKNGTVDIFKGFETILKTSQCKETCEECHDLGSVKYLFSPGSVLILGLFSIHWGSDEEPFACGAYREKSASYIAMSAFLNSIQQLRSRTGAVDFGYLIIDDCYNVLTVTKMLNKIMSGDLPIVSLDTGEKFDPSKVAVAVGAQSTPVTMAAVPVLQNLGIPMISYSSTSPNLDSRVFYPYFSRTVSSDAVQATAITNILKELKVTYVGAIVIQNSYGLELYKLLRTMAEAEDICVDDAFEMTDKTTVEEVETKLMTYRARVIKVIVAIAMDSVASKILSAVRQEDTFVFIASEAWGPNPDILNGDRGERARGSLVLGASTSVQLDYGLKDYLQTIEPFNHNKSTWLREFWQEQFKCDLPGGFNNVHHVFCLEKNTYFSEEMLDNLVHAPLAVHSTMATMSAGFAVESLLKQQRKMPFDATEITQAIRTVQLTSANGVKFRPFLDSGNGNGGFQIYSIQNDGGKYVYVDVGSYLSSGGLKIDSSKVNFYDVTGNVIKTVNSSCMFQRECTRVCAENSSPDSNPVAEPSETTESSQEAETKGSSTDPAVIALSVMCGLLIGAIIIVVLVLVHMARSSSKKDDYYTDHSRDLGSSVVSFSRTVGNQYIATEDSRTILTENPPTLPCRENSSVSQEVYNNKAFSDIVTTGASHSATHPGEVRERSMSMPTGSDSGLESFPEQDLPTTTASNTLSLPRPHKPLKVRSKPSQNSEQVVQSPQIRPTPEVQSQPLQPSFYLGDGVNHSHPHGTLDGQNDQAQAPNNKSQVDELEPLSGHASYENGSQLPLSCNLSEPIIFQNVHDNSMIYPTSYSTDIMSPMPTMASQQNPNVQNPIMVSYDTYPSWLNSNAQRGRVVHGPPVQPSAGSNTDIAGMDCGVPAPQIHHLNAAPPAPCVPKLGPNDYITPKNVIYVDAGRIQTTTTQSPPRSVAQGIPLYNAPGIPMYPAHLTDPSTAFGNMMSPVLPQSNVQMLPNPTNPAFDVMPNSPTQPDSQQHPLKQANLIQKVPGAPQGTSRAVSASTRSLDIPAEPQPGAIKNTAAQAHAEEEDNIMLGAEDRPLPEQAEKFTFVRRPKAHIGGPLTLAHPRHSDIPEESGSYEVEV